MNYLLLAGSMILAIAGQLFLKGGVMASSLSLNFNSIITTLFSPKVFLGFTLYGISSIIWLFALKKFPLSVAYPALSMTYIVVVLFSYLLFKEPLTANKIIGMLLIVGGVFILFR